MIKDKIERIKLKDLKAYPDNPRKHDKKQIEQLASQIKIVGFNQPIIVDESNTVLVGNGRLEAADLLNFEELPCIRYDKLSEAQKKQLIVADNKLNDISIWDDNTLGNWLNELNEEGLESYFTPEEMTEIWDLPDLENNTKEDNFEPPKQAKYKVKNGDIYQLGEHRLMCGDSTDKIAVSALFDKIKPILMVTDPPYGVNYDPKWRDELDKKGILGNRYPTQSLGIVKNDNRIDWSNAYSLFEGDIMYIYHAGKYSSEVAESIKKIDFELISQIIWVKPHFALSRGDYHWRHEPCWYAVRKGKKHNWQGSRKEDTVWEIAGMNAMGASHDEADKSTGHGTQKPIECMYKPIINNSNENDVVYDPFGGSGSTLIACERANRKCYMMEIDEYYCSVIIERWEKLTGKEHSKLN